MNVTTATVTTGTVKVGRWTYPARIEPVAPNQVARNTQRDGSGDWEYANEKVAATFVADEVEIASTPAEVEASADFQAAREIYTTIFDSFAVTADELPVEGMTEKRALEIARYLEGVQVEDDNGQPIPLVVRDAKGGENGKTPIWQSWETYDSIETATALARFDAVVPRDLKVKATAIRLAKPVNNTHAKPGKSTWVIGTPCPKGHTLTEVNLYTMPSGRHQCKDCRAGYPSNV